ncbi:anti-sigma factor [Qipengyuania sp. S6317L1]|uniref:anti-sigma factor n=1 Tax=Qipengyuania sp. S6317L1 TaxID=2926410 RepID=UPI001FF64FB1|nr:anti-sigma factor [Qipengyuania sp. S6317L1]MCK0098003.1 anti-sigma factor [Qipengyuania sp. S6317L1]
MGDDFMAQGDDPAVLAGALVLGMLEGAELTDAQRRRLEDAGFRNACEWWEWRLGSMAEAAPSLTPSADVWRAIEARIDAMDASEGGGATPLQSRRVYDDVGWNLGKPLALAGLAAAAVAAVFLFLPQSADTDVGTPYVQASSSPQLIAQLQDETGARKLASRIDSDRRTMVLSITGLEAETGQAPELWVIPEGGDPVSLGSIPEQGEFRRVISEDEAQLLQGGATIAVTFEEDTGVPHKAPTPPILLAGPLDQV